MSENMADVFKLLKKNESIVSEKEKLNKDKSKDDSKETMKTDSDSDMKSSSDTSNKTSSKTTGTVTTPQKEVSEVENDGEGEVDSSQNSHDDSFSENILNKFKVESKKPTIEETHTRNTLFIRNDLHKRLQKITKNKRGLKTMLVNEAVEAVLDILEDK